MLSYSFNTNFISKLIKFVLKGASNLLCFSLSSLWCRIKNICPPQDAIKLVSKTEKTKNKKEEMLVISSIFKIWAGKTWDILPYFLFTAHISCNTDSCCLACQEWRKGLCNYELSFLKWARPSISCSKQHVTDIFVGHLKDSCQSASSSHGSISFSLQGMMAALTGQRAQPVPLCFLISSMT